MRNAYNILVVIPWEKRPHGRHRYRLEDNIKIDLKEIDCTDPAQWSLLGILCVILGGGGCMYFKFKLFREGYI
jgi:hypothetical protein